MDLLADWFNQDQFSEESESDLSSGSEDEMEPEDLLQQENYLETFSRLMNIPNLLTFQKGQNREEYENLMMQIIGRLSDFAVPPVL